MTPASTGIARYSIAAGDVDLRGVTIVIHVLEVIVDGIAATGPIRSKRVVGIGVVRVCGSCCALIGIAVGLCGQPSNRRQIP